MPDEAGRALAARIVVFEYLVPAQRKARRDATTRAFLIHGDVGAYPTLEDMMGHLLRLSDALLGSRGYPTSFRFPRATCQFGLQTTNALTLCSDPIFKRVLPRERAADPTRGYRIFEGRQSTQGRVA